MEDNTEYAYSRLKDRSRHTLLTGDAGSGKTTLIKRFIEEHRDETIVCASTGIAGVLIGGMTIHKLFSFPALPVGYKQIKTLSKASPTDEMKMELFKAAKYLIIEEISMVRADLMDQIAWFLYKNFKDQGHFAGLKIIMVGDINQLPPVVTDKDAPKLYDRYSSPYFFDAACWNPERHSSFEVVKLNKVWRQNDPYFIEILNSIKNNDVSPLDVDRLNARCYHPTKDNGGVMLCSTNKIAIATNQQKLAEVQEESIYLTGDKSGDFPENSMPVSFHMELKSGCRIMTIVNHAKNDFVNGSIGTFLRQDESNIIVKFDNEQEETKIGRHLFENIDYIYNEAKGKMETKTVGKFVQYPVKLAYALTIHRSQGQTFDKIIIDMGTRGAFAHGQTYVALSRCRSIEGIILRQPLSLSDFIYDKTVLEFNKKMNEKITV